MEPVSCPVLIGRDEEWRLLLAALQAAEAGRGQFVVMTGEAGIGKSRLAGDLVSAARSRRHTVLVGRAVPATTSGPYRPLTAALLQALRDHDVRNAVELQPWLPLLRAVVPTIAAVDTVTASDIPVARAEAVLQLLRHVAGGNALLLLLEDLHWADSDTLAILEYLCDNVATEPVLCVATCRTTTTEAAGAMIGRLRSRRAGTHLVLPRLDAEQVAQMVRACRPDATMDAVTRAQRVAEGVPLLVEESLLAAGVPGVFADTVTTRMRALTEDDRSVLHAAALLGRRFDWRLLTAATGLEPKAVAGALERGVEAQLLAVEDDSFVFRHTLTRDAITAGLVPTQRARVAAAVLHAVERAHPTLSASWSDLAADLAVEAGDDARAGELLLASGRQAIERGALATAADTLRRAKELSTDVHTRDDANRLLRQALSTAGRLDEALDVADAMATERAHPLAAGEQAALHLDLAHAALAATRWAFARRQIDLAAAALAADPPPGSHAQLAVLDGELAFVNNDLRRARSLAETALGAPDGAPDVRCQALQLLGRVQRGTDLAAARRAFEESLVIAESAHLAVWRLRALHELGTVDMFDHAGTDLLTSARQLAGELGALSTGAVIDIQLAATGLFRFDLDGSERAATTALETSTRLRLTKVRATALVFLAEARALRQDQHEAERLAALAEAAAPEDPEIAGSVQAGVHGLLALLDGDTERAMTEIRRGVKLLAEVPSTGPAHYRGLWLLLLAAQDDRDADHAVRAASDTGILVNRINRGFVQLAAAILAGRSGDAQQANDLATSAQRDLRLYPVWLDLAMLLATPAARQDAWGEPGEWVSAAQTTFEAHGIRALVERCRHVVDVPMTSRWSKLGITEREADVLRLVAQGLSNRQIAAQLHVSHRTVEKHVEALLRKSAAQSRTQLVAIAGPERSDRKHH